MISRGVASVSIDDIYQKFNDGDILFHYLGITEVPCVIKSPLREDKNPSFGFYSSDGIHIHWVDFANRERGGTLDLLCRMWGLPLNKALERINTELCSKSKVTISTTEGCNVALHHNAEDSSLQCRIRPWRDYDAEYWRRYGISIEWLKFADVYPISYKIITKAGRRMVLPADKYAYAYVERKEGNVTLKIYQPFNVDGYKWANKHDRSVISLWTKIPQKGKMVCICSSLKDALCLWANTGIPSIAIQGEGYPISKTAIRELRNRFERVFIMLDNDAAGLYDARKLAESTGFTNVVLPHFDGGKDISDYFYSLQDPQKFIKTIKKLFNL